MQVELVPGAAILLVLFLVTLWAFKFHQARGKLPPGPRPWLFLGNLLQKDVLPLFKTYAKLTKKYGPVFTIWLGVKPMVVICGYEGVRDALVTHNEEFSGRPPIALFAQITKGYGLISEHERWKVLRRFALTTLRNFGMGKRLMAERILEEAHCLLGKISTFEGQPFDIVPAITASISNVMCSVVFGNRFSYEDKNFTELLDIFKTFNGFFLSIPGVMYSALPNIMNFLPGPHKKVFSDCNKVCDFIRSKVDSHKKTLDPENPRDFIDCFLIKLEKDSAWKTSCVPPADKRGCSPNTGKLSISYEQVSSVICMEDLVMSVFDIFLAGTESTGTTISFGLIILAKFSHIQAKAQQEIDEVVGTNRAPCMEDRMEMTYTKAVIHEILRYLQASIENFPRMTTQDVNFRGHFIPQGTTVLPLGVSVHFDPLWWEDPEKFDPGHFLNEKGKFQMNNAYFPFSAGKRACPGEALADMELFLFFTTLLQHFTFELIIDPDKINLVTLFTDCKKNGKHRYLRAIKREI